MKAVNLATHFSKKSLQSSSCFYPLEAMHSLQGRHNVLTISHCPNVCPLSSDNNDSSIGQTWRASPLQTCCCGVTRWLRAVFSSVVILYAFIFCLQCCFMPIICHRSVTEWMTLFFLSTILCRISVNRVPTYLESRGINLVREFCWRSGNFGSLRTKAAIFVYVSGQSSYLLM